MLSFVSLVVFTSLLLLSFGSNSCLESINEDCYSKILNPVEIEYISESDLKDSYDFIVIGAGASGSVVASRLALDSSNPNVLLIEAGDKADTSILSNQMMPVATETQRNETQDWYYPTEPITKFYDSELKGNETILKDNIMYWPRGKVMGGTSVLNYCMYVRGSKFDYDQLWKINNWEWKDVLPFFKKMESVKFKELNDEDKVYRSNNGPIPVTVAYKSPLLEAMFKQTENLGMKYLDDYNGEEQLGGGLTQFNILKYRHNSFISYIGKLCNNDENKNRINLDVLPNYYVSKLLFNEPENNKVIGLKAINMKNNNEITVNLNHENKGEIIVSGGAVESPKLLMLSGIGPKEELEKHGIKVIRDLPGVGRNLQDHVICLLRYKLTENNTHDPFLVTDKSASDNMELLKYVISGHGLLNTTTTDGTWFVRTKYAEKIPNFDGPDFQFLLVNSPWKTDDSLTLNNKDKLYHFYDSTVRDSLDSDWDISNNHWHPKQVVLSGYMLHPRSVGNISLASNSPLDYPKIYPNYFTDKNKEDLYTMIEGLKIIDSIMLSDELKPFIERKLNKIDENGEIVSEEGFVKRSFNTVFHPVGTCKMVNDFEKDEFGVVNSALKVKGFINLRIADASIMPTLTSGNTQVPCYMIGEKASDIILKEWNDKNKQEL